MLTESLCKRVPLILTLHSLPCSLALHRFWDRIQFSDHSYGTSELLWSSIFILLAPFPHISKFSTHSKLLGFPEYSLLFLFSVLYSYWLLHRIKNSTEVREKAISQAWVPSGWTLPLTSFMAQVSLLISIYKMRIINVSQRVCKDSMWIYIYIFVIYIRKCI